MEIELKLGQEFIADDFRLMVVEGKGCKNCFFNREDSCKLDENLLCSCEHRKDKKDVIFVKSNLPEVSDLPTPKEQQKEDFVNHPKHYTSHPSGIECIDVIEHMTLCTGNAVKYLWRAGQKREEGMTDLEKQIEDLKKSSWYIQREIKRLEKMEEAK